MRESGPSLTEIGEWRYETVHHMGRRCWNWDYTERCIYEITVVLKDRRKGWLGCLRENTQTQDQRENARQEGVALGGFCRANSGRRVRDARWFVELTADGEAVVDALQEMPRRYPQVSLLEWQVMPEHVHFVVFVKEKLDRPFGALVRGFKAGAVKRWKSLRENAQTQDQRELVSTELPEWSEGFVDVILWRDGQLQAMLDYLADNPRRLAMKRADPGLFKRVVDLQIVLKIGDASSRCREELVGHFSAIGNRFLLEAPLAQVQVSRRFCRYRRITLPSGGSKIARDASGEPIIELETPEYRARRDELLAAARHGAVLVSPCVSDGERQIAREALSAGMKLITMSSPSSTSIRFDGSTLPWSPQSTVTVWYFTFSPSTAKLTVRVWFAVTFVKVNSFESSPSSDAPSILTAETTCPMSGVKRKVTLPPWSTLTIPFVIV